MAVHDAPHAFIERETIPHQTLGKMPSRRSIAHAYGVGAGTISHIKHRTTWAWLD